MEALALAELVFHLPGTLFGLLEAAHGVRLLVVTEVDVAQVEVGTVEILQQLTLPRQRETNKAVWKGDVAIGYVMLHAC